VAAEVWVSVISLGGVALGGALSFLVQERTQQRNEQAAARKQQTDLAEVRRAERLALVERFIGVAAEAERCAFDRKPNWNDGDKWAATAREVMHRLWIAERLIRVQFPLPVHDAARAYFLDLNRAVWQDLADDENVRDLLEDNRLVFLDAARAAIEAA
jgi:hypothetical protein